MHMQKNVDLCENEHSSECKSEGLGSERVWGRWGRKGGREMVSDVGEVEVLSEGARGGDRGRRGMKMGIERYYEEGMKDFKESWEGCGIEICTGRNSRSAPTQARPAPAPHFIVMRWPP